MAEYERRKAHRDAIQQQQEGEQAQNVDRYGDLADDTPAAQAKMKANMTREQRIGLSSAR